VIFIIWVCYADENPLVRYPLSVLVPSVSGKDKSAFISQYLQSAVTAGTSFLTGLTCKILKLDISNSGYFSTIFPNPPWR